MRLLRALSVFAAMLIPCVAGSAPVKGTHAYDYRNNPYVGALLDREVVILSPRGMLAPGRVDSLVSAGVKVYVLIQPNQIFTNGVAIGSRPGDVQTFPWDTATYNLAVKYNAIMRDSTGAYLDMFGGTSWQGMVLDFRIREFGSEYAALIASMFPKLSGVVFDYGCGDLAWMALKIDPSVWVDWRAGWKSFVADLGTTNPQIATIAQCDQWPNGFSAEFDGILLERVGSALNPPVKSWNTTKSHKVFYRQEWTDPRTRRLFAGMALLSDGLFDQCGDPNKVPPVHIRDLEHFELSLGIPGDTWWERVPNVYQRMFSRGLVIVNMQSWPYYYEASRTKTYEIMPYDALVAQTRSPDGRWIKWITNSGR